MTTSGRSSETRRSGRSVSQWLLGLLIVLALAASVLMIFTDNLSITGTLAVIAALWAAVIGAVLVTRFRKQAETAEARSRDLRLVYELQLEREISARRQYELDVETTIRKEVAAESGGELASLKEQVVSLRASLERLLGEALPDDQVALPKEKLRELASGLGGNGLDPDPFGTSYAATTHDSGRVGRSYGAAAYGSPERYGASDFNAPDFSAPDDGLVAARDFAETVPAVDDGRHVERTADPNEMTEVIPVVTDDPLSGGFSVVGHEFSGAEGATPGQSAPAEPAAPFVDETPTDEWDRRATTSSGFATGAAAPEESEPTPFWARGRHETSADRDLAGSEPGVGRSRRAEEKPVAVDEPDDDADSAHSNGLPVSELLKQLRAADAGGRRRRRD